MKKHMSTTFTNAIINIEDMTITEYTKDDKYVFDLNKILEDWNNIDGLTLSIKKEDKITD